MRAIKCRTDENPECMKTKYSVAEKGNGSMSGKSTIVGVHLFRTFKAAAFLTVHAWASPALSNLSSYTFLKIIPLGGVESWDYISMR